MSALPQPSKPFSPTFISRHTAARPARDRRRSPHSLPLPSEIPSHSQAPAPAGEPRRRLRRFFPSVLRLRHVHIPGRAPARSRHSAALRREASVRTNLRYLSSDRPTRARSDRGGSDQSARAQRVLGVRKRRSNRLQPYCTCCCRGDTSHSIWRLRMPYRPHGGSRSRQAPSRPLGQRSARSTLQSQWLPKPRKPR